MGRRKVEQGHLTFFWRFIYNKWDSRQNSCTGVKLDVMSDDSGCVMGKKIEGNFPTDRYKLLPEKNTLCLKKHPKHFRL